MKVYVTWNGMQDKRGKGMFLKLLLFEGSLILLFNTLITEYSKFSFQM